MLRPRIHDASYSSVAIKRIPKKVTHKSYHIYTLLLIQICRYNVKRSDSLDTPNINARERFNPHPSNNSSMTAAVHFLHIRRLHASMRPSMSTFALRLTLINSISICSRLNVPTSQGRLTTIPMSKRPQAFTMDINCFQQSEEHYLAGSRCVLRQIWPYVFLVILALPVSIDTIMYPLRPRMMTWKNVEQEKTAVALFLMFEPS